MSRSSEHVPRVPLRDGPEIPQLGLGVFQVSSEQTAEVVAEALSIGYRHIDTAAAYGNEAEVGRGTRGSGLDRDELFVTTKCANRDQGHDEARGALAASLQRLALDHVDLYLIHWPAPARERYLETWRALIELRSEGLTRSIGVSNFHAAHLREIIEETGETPSINQIELHPYLQQRELRSEHERLGIVTEAWSPLAQGAVLEERTILEIADAHERTAAQVVIRWHLQLGNVVIPKSVTPARMRENFEALDFDLSEQEMSAIESLDRGRRTGPDPESFTHPQF